MAIIYSYPPNSNILPTDILVGTSTVIVAGKPKNQTKSFSIQNLANFISPLISIDLNDVLTIGNTSLLDAKIGKLYLHDTAVTDYGKLQLNNNAFTVTNALNNNIISSEVGTLRVWNTLGVEGVFSYASLTGGRIYNLPDNSGTIALTSDIPIVTGFVPYTGATQAVNLGAFNMLVNGLSVGRGPGNITTNTTVGFQALNSNTIGLAHTAIGYQALFSNIGNFVNTGVGYQALYNNTTGSNNTAVGGSSLFGNTTGSGNTAVGGSSLRGNSTGNQNVAIGFQTMFQTNTGSNNLAVGYNALTNNNTGGQNVALGHSALVFNTTGNDNTAVGENAISNNTTGIQNVGIGKSSSLLNATDSNSIVIGYNTTGVGSNTVTIGNGAITTTRLRGTVQGGSFVKDGGTATQYLMADGSVTTAPYKYNFAGSLVLTGTLITTNLLTITIPANSLTDYLDLRSLMVQQSGPALAGMQVRVWHNSVNDFNTATRIANYAFGAGGADLFAQMTRKFSLQSGLLFGFSATGSNIAGEGSTANAALSIPFNPTTINYLFVSIQLNNATDTAILRNVNITT